MLLLLLLSPEVITCFDSDVYPQCFGFVLKVGIENGVVDCGLQGVCLLHGAALIVFRDPL